MRQHEPPVFYGPVNTTFSHNDHRIAMSIAVSALRCKGEVVIENAECVAKSYPTFFEDLESIIVR